MHCKHKLSHKLGKEKGKFLDSFCFLILQECENLESELTVKMNLIEDMKKKLDDAKEVEKQYKALDQQLKTLSSKKESMAINLLALEVHSF